MGADGRRRTDGWTDARGGVRGAWAFEARGRSRRVGVRGAWAQKGVGGLMGGLMRGLARAGVCSRGRVCAYVRMCVCVYVCMCVVGMDGPPRRRIAFVTIASATPRVMVDPCASFRRHRRSARSTSFESVRTAWSLGALVPLALVPLVSLPLVLVPLVSLCPRRASQIPSEPSITVASAAGSRHERTSGRAEMYAPAHAQQYTPEGVGASSKSARATVARAERASGGEG